MLLSAFRRESVRWLRYSDHGSSGGRKGNALSTCPSLFDPHGDAQKHLTGQQDSWRGACTWTQALSREGGPWGPNTKDSEHARPGTVCLPLALTPADKSDRKICVHVVMNCRATQRCVNDTNNPVNIQTLVVPSFLEQCTSYNTKSKMRKGLFYCICHILFRNTFWIVHDCLTCEVQVDWVNNVQWERWFEI